MSLVASHQSLALHVQWRRRRLAAVRVCLCLMVGAALWLLGPTAARAQFDNKPPAGADPYVLLDYGKLMLEDGRIEKAYEWLQQIPLGQAEGYVDEEILIQRLIIAGAFVRSATFLGTEVTRHHLSGPYLNWLGQQRADYSRDFCAAAQDYLGRTAEGYSCTFIRFRLPQVTEAHLQDLELYAAEEMLHSAADNYAEGRDTLGRGLLIAQARAAIVLNAAPHYDLAEASSTLRGVSGRLRVGVPIYPAVLLDWLAQLSADCAIGPDELAHTALLADARLLSLPGGAATARFQERARLRARQPALLAAAKGEHRPGLIASGPADVSPGGLKPGPAEDGAPAGPPAAAPPLVSPPAEGPPAAEEGPGPPAGAGAAEDGKEPEDEAGPAEDGKGDAGAGDGDAEPRDPPKHKRPKPRPIPRRPRV